jgi:prepilin-type N-terminal cleavage/methylation domain-containing protein
MFVHDTQQRAQGQLHRRRGPCHASRSGFTLIELLVVISIILALAALAVMFIPNLDQQQRAAQGGSLLQGWLNIAKQRALRDQAPRGLRLYMTSDPTLPSTVADQAQYIEQPDDFTGGTLTGSGNAVAISGADLTGGETDPTLWSVQAGDVLEVWGTGLVHQITGVTQVSASPPVFNLALAGAGLPVATPATGTTTYRIIRAPRVSGEDVLQMPSYVGVDMTTFTANGIAQVNYAVGYVDVLFSPSGNVMGAYSGLDFLAFWVRDVGSPTYTIYDGDPTLIAVYVRSGLVAAHPPNPPPADAYQFVKDGRSSGQ